MQGVRSKADLQRMALARYRRGIPPPRRSISDVLNKNALFNGNLVVYGGTGAFHGNFFVLFVFSGVILYPVLLLSGGVLSPDFFVLGNDMLKSKKGPAARQRGGSGPRRLAGRIGRSSRSGH